MNSNNIFMKSVKPLYEDNNNVINLNFSESLTLNNNTQKGGRLSKLSNSDNILNLSFSPSIQVPHSNNFSMKQSGGSNNDMLNLSFSPSLQMPSNTVNSADSLLNLSFSPSIQAPSTSQSGGSNELLNLSFSASIPVPSSDDTTEYFNKLANKIVNKVDSSQTGGFKINTSAPKDIDHFLSSETIENINNISPSYKKNKKNDTDIFFKSDEVQDGGAKKSIKSKDTQLNFDTLKKHIKRAVELNNSESKSNSSIDELFTDEDDETDEESDSILNGTTSDDEDEDEDEDSDEDEELDSLHGIDRSDKKVRVIIPTKNRLIPVDVKQSRSRKNKKHSESTSASNSSDASLNNPSESDYKLSESISSPKLMSYRSVNKNNVASGTRKFK
jgi:hypothetical protein